MVVLPKFVEASIKVAEHGEWDRLSRGLVDPLLERCALSRQRPAIVGARVLQIALGAAGLEMHAQEAHAAAIALDHDLGPPPEWAAIGMLDAETWNVTLGDPIE